jgi:hypothetical protein
VIFSGGNQRWEACCELVAESAPGSQSPWASPLTPEPAPAHPGLHHDWEEATRALEQDPYSAQPRLSRSKVARLEGWRLTAYHEARWARALAPHDAAPHRALGLAALGLGRRG